MQNRLEENVTLTEFSTTGHQKDFKRTYFNNKGDLRGQKTENKKKNRKSVNKYSQKLTSENYDDNV